MVTDNESRRCWLTLKAATARNWKSRAGSPAAQDHHHPKVAGSKTISVEVRKKTYVKRSLTRSKPKKQRELEEQRCQPKRQDRRRLERPANRPRPKRARQQDKPPGRYSGCGSGCGSCCRASICGCLERKKRIPSCRGNRKTSRCAPMTTSVVIAKHAQHRPAPKDKAPTRALHRLPSTDRKSMTSVAVVVAG